MGKTCTNELTRILLNLKAPQIVTLRTHVSISIADIFQKLSAIVQQRESLVACDVHRFLVLLLSANDVIVLHCTLHALISLAQR